MMSLKWLGKPEDQMAESEGAESDAGGEEAEGSDS